MALFGNADESIQVQISSKANNKGFKDASNAAGSLSNKMNKVGLGTIAFGNLIATGMQSAARSFTNMGKSAISSTSDYEQSRIAFETMLGSAERAGSMLADITEFAKTTPFNLPQVVTGAKQLLAYGITAEEVLKDMEGLGNIAAGVGREKLPFLTLAFGQVRTKGKLAGQEIRQFTEAGVPLIEELAKSLGKTKEEIVEMSEAGEIGFDVVRDAIRGMSKEGGRFDGLMDKQSRTFGGIVSNIQDGFGQIARSVVGISKTGEIIENSLFDRMKKAAEATMPFVQRMAEDAGPAMIGFMDKLSSVGGAVVDVGKSIFEFLGPKVVALANTIREDMIPVLVEFWKKYLEPLVPIIGSVLVLALGLAIDALNGIVLALSGVVEFMTNNEMIFLPLITVIGILWAAMKVQAGFQAITAGLNLLTSTTIPQVIGKFVAMKGLIMTPIVMPAIAIGAALLALNHLIDKWHNTVDEINRQQTSHGEGTTSFFESLKRARDEGRISQDEYTRRLKGYNANFQSFTEAPFLAKGGAARANRPHIVGEEGPELFIPRNSGTVVSNKDSADILSGGSSGRTFKTEIGNVILQDASAVDRFFERLDVDNNLSEKGLTPSRGF